MIKTLNIWKKSLQKQEWKFNKTVGTDLNYNNLKLWVRAQGADQYSKPVGARLQNQLFIIQKAKCKN